MFAAFYEKQLLSLRILLFCNILFWGDPVCWKLNEEGETLPKRLFVTFSVDVIVWFNYGADISFSYIKADDKILFLLLCSVFTVGLNVHWANSLD